MTNAALYSFLNALPPLAARIWSPLNSSRRRNYIIYDGSRLEAQQGCAIDGVFVAEIVLPSGALLAEVVEEGAPETALERLVSRFARGAEEGGIYGVTPSMRPNDLDAVFLPIAAQALEIKPVRINGETTPVALRIEGDVGRIRVVVEEPDAFASAIVAPMLDTPVRRGAVDVVPVVRDDGTSGIELIHHPSLAASFFRYLEVDAIDAAVIIGRRIFVRVSEERETALSGGDLLSASLFALRFGGAEASRVMSSIVDDYAENPRYESFASDLRLAGRLLRYWIDEPGEDFAARTLAQLKADDVPTSTWLLIYANRYLTDFAIDHDQRSALREPIMQLSKWTHRLDLQRPFPSYLRGSVNGPGAEPPRDFKQRVEELDAAKKKSEAN